LQRVSRGYRADSGFMSQVGTKSAEGGAYRAIHSDGKRKWFTRLGFGAYGDYAESTEGGKPSGDLDFPIEYEGPKQLSIEYNPSQNWEYYAGTTYYNVRHNFGMSVRPSGSVSLSVNGSAGGAVDFSNARKATQRRFNPEIELKLGRPLSATVSHSFQRLNVAGGRLFTANLTELRAVYYFSSRMFVRAIAQYTNVDRDPSLYLVPVAPNTKRLFSQLLFSYKLNAQTVALLGYADNARGDRDLDVTRTDRTFFVKVGYAWLP
jgi:hypothetical protein